MEYKMSRRRWGIGLIAGLAGALAVGGGELHDLGEQTEPAKEESRLYVNIAKEVEPEFRLNVDFSPAERYRMYSYSMNNGSRRQREDNLIGKIKESQKKKRNMLKLAGAVIEDLEKTMPELEKCLDEEKINKAYYFWKLTNMDLGRFPFTNSWDKRNMGLLEGDLETASERRSMAQTMQLKYESRGELRKYAVGILQNIGVKVGEGADAEDDIKDTGVYQFFKEDIEKDASKTRGGEICLAYMQKLAQGVVDKHMKKSQNPKQDLIRAQAAVDLLLMTAVKKSKDSSGLNFKLESYCHQRIERFFRGDTCIGNEAAALADAASIFNPKANNALAFNYIMDTPYSEIAGIIFAKIEDNRKIFREVEETKVLSRELKSDELKKIHADLEKRAEKFIPIFEKAGKIRRIGTNLIID